MLKRIQSKLALAEKDEIYMPMEEELAHPEKTEQEIYQEIELKNSFKGQHQCKLCPNKVIMTDRDLSEHLSSKSHKLRLRKFWRAHEP